MDCICQFMLLLRSDNTFVISELQEILYNSRQGADQSLVSSGVFSDGAAAIYEGKMLQITD